MTGTLARMSDQEQPSFRYTARLANEIEAKWQDRWDADHTFWTSNPAGPLAGGEAAPTKPKLFVLDMFPYPSGAGLHVGHPLGFIGTDVYARFMRMNGHHVLHAMGYDAFGLPAEQYAVEHGRHPRDTTDANVANMRRQLRALGLGHDSRRSVATTDPQYYRWTQWIFLQIFDSWYDEAADGGIGRADPSRSWSPSSSRAAAPQNDAVSDLNADGVPWADLDAGTRRALIDSYRLAYVDDAPVNWCPGLGTVLANEEVTADGRSERGNHPVFKRPLQQWKLRITVYTDRLLDDLALLDWPESIKTMQRNWIGRSTGAAVAVLGGGARGRRPRGVHHPPRHVVRRHLHGGGARAPVARRDRAERVARRHDRRRLRRHARELEGHLRRRRTAVGRGAQVRGVRARARASSNARPRAATRLVCSPVRSPPTRPPAGRSRSSWPTTC